MEVLSIISIGESILAFGPFCETRWNPRFLGIPDKPFKVMKGVEGLLHAARQLLDAMESVPMHELVFVVLRERFPLLLEGASLLGIALESLIEKTLYSVVVPRLAFIPRVEISGNGPPRAYDDEYAILVTGYHN